MSRMEGWMSKLADGRQKLLFFAGTLFWSAVMVLFLSQVQLLLGTNPSLMMRRRMEVLILAAALVLLWAGWMFCYFRQCRKRKARKVGIWHFLLLFAEAVYLFLQVEFINNPLLLDMEIGYKALNVAFIFVFLLLMFLALNSFKWTILLGSIASLIISLVFYFVYLLRGEPFQFIDIFSVGTAMEVAGGYDFTLTREIVIFAALTLALLAMVWQSRDARLARRLKWKLIWKGIAAGTLALLYVLYLNVGWNGGLGILTDLYRPYQTYGEYGTTVGFLCVAKYMRLTPPDGYSVEEVERLAEETKIEEDGREEKVKPVNIICIMNESWADYRYLGDFAVNEPYSEYYDSMKENTIKGNTLVCIQGGGTAKTEYEFLTGNSVKRFPGMVPYVSYFTHDQHSLVSTLKDQGYTVEAMHPNKGSNWKRTSAYRLLGFEEFFTIDDFDTSAMRIRQHISDKANYDKIIERVNSKENKDDPYFLFDVTMQNHGGYTSTTYQGEVETIGYTDSSVNQFLSLQKDSDEALEYLIEYFKDYDEPTMIVMFGDHYPDLPDTFTQWITGKTFDESTLAEQQRYYATPFFIWANYDIPSEEGILTSTNYLSTMMLSQTGLQMTSYNYYLEQLRQKIPALNHLGYQDAEGTFTAWEDADEKYDALEQEYEALQYNELAEDSKRLDEFFTVK